MRSRILLAAPLSALILVLGGCQSYERRPLDLESHGNTLRARGLAVESVRAYAERVRVSDDADTATAFDDADGLDLAEAELAALVLNPRLRAARLAARVEAVGAEHAGRWEDPRFEADVLRVLESVDRPWIAGVGIGFTIPLSGRLAAEKAEAAAEARAALAEVRVAEWELLGELREAWYAWSAAEREAELHREYGGRLARLAELATRLADAGEAATLEARLLRIEGRTHGARARAAAARAQERRAAVLRVMGLLPGAPVELLPTLEPVAPADGERLLDHPRVSLARAEYDVAEERLRREVRKQHPDLTIGPAAGWEEGQSRVGLGLGLPIPLLNRNAREIAEAAAERDAKRAAAEAAYEAALHDAAALRAQADAAAEAERVLREEVAPLVDEQLREAEALIAAGEMDVLLLREVLAQSLEAKAQVLEAAMTLARLRSRMRLNQEGTADERR